MGGRSTEAISLFLNWHPLCHGGKSECSDSALRAQPVALLIRAPELSPSWPGAGTAPARPHSGALFSVLYHFLLVTFFLSEALDAACPSLWGLLSPQQLRRGTDTRGLPPCCFLSFPFKPYIHPTPRQFLFFSAFFFFSCYPSPGKDKATVIKTMNKVTKTHSKMMD